MSNLFKPNYILVGLLIVPITLLSFLVIGTINAPAIRALGNGESIFGLGWIPLIIVDLLTIGSAIVICWGVIVGLRTEITDSHIRRPTLRGTITILWSEVSSLEVRGWWLKLKTRDNTLIISVLFYKNPTEVLHYIKNRLKL